MTYPAKTAQVKPTPNTAPLRLDEQLEQAKKAFSDAKQKRVRKTRSDKFRFVSPAAAKRMGLMTPQNRCFYENPSRQRFMPTPYGKQCKVMAKIIAYMFPAYGNGGGFTL